ncbi:MAG: PIN domain-containing protein [Gaiellaceae bacterium]
MTAYLADTSIWAWARREPVLAEKLARRLGGGSVATCVPVALELLHSTRDVAEYERLLARLRRLEWVPPAVEAAREALGLQRSLAATTHGAHRMPAVDYLVAGIAGAAVQDVVVWHADRDLRRLCEHAGIPHEVEEVGNDGTGGSGQPGR